MLPFTDDDDLTGVRPCARAVIVGRGFKILRWCTCNLSTQLSLCACLVARRKVWFSFFRAIVLAVLSVAIRIYSHLVGYRGSR